MTNTEIRTNSFDPIAYMQQSKDIHDWNTRREDVKLNIANRQYQDQVQILARIDSICGATLKSKK